MPTLNWMGKDKVVNHHRDVPYRVLVRDAEKSVLDSHGSDCGNMIIHGDNLEALKALLPECEGKVDCIYIDPPYNTGNEGWVYNDNVNDPRIQRWLGQVVGKEGEDFSRHDKWLCMMYPRLQLLRKMLAPTGAIFISIGDEESANLRLVCDEIFGSSCFVGDVIWQKTYSPRNDSKGIPTEAEHLYVYSKNTGWMPGRLPRTAEMDQRYSSPDGDPRAWKAGDASAPGAATHQGMVYAIQHPLTGELLYPPNGRCRPFGGYSMLNLMSEWADYEWVDIHDEERRAQICGVPVEEIRPGVQALMLKNESQTTFDKARQRYEQGSWPILYFTSHGRGGMACKRYLDEMPGRLPTNLWPYSEVGHTDEATKELKAIFEGRSPFDTPKPTRLIERILKIATDGNSLVLDSFGGSATTAQAVMKANAGDGGHRRYILVELMDYADSITAERVRRVISGYGSGSSAVEGIDSGFSYYELGPALFDGDGSLNPDVTRDDLKRYVWYTETKADFVDLSAEHPYLLGEIAGTVYYLAYEPEGETVLSYELLSTLPRRGQTTVIYADRCALSSEVLGELGIRFKQIPRQIARF